MSDSHSARRGLRLVDGDASDDAGRLRALANRASTKLIEHGGAVGEIRTDLPVLIRYVRAYVRGDYRRVPWASVALAASALAYFVMPADLIPDVLLGPGFLDDAAVIAFVIRSLRSDLKAFEAWESEPLAP